MPGAGQLGDRPGPALGRAAAPLGRRRLRRLRRAARGRSTPRRTSSSGSRTPAGTARPDYAARYDTWLVVVRRAGHRGGRLRLDQPAPRRRRDAPGARTRDFLEWPYDVEQPVAPGDGRVGRGRRGARRASTSAPGSWCAPTSSRRPRARPARRTPRRSCCASSAGLRRARQADTVEAALVGACDGELTVGQILDALAQLLDRDPAQTREAYLPVVRELVVEGFLEPRPRASAGTARHGSCGRTRYRVRP